MAKKKAASNKHSSGRFKMLLIADIVFVPDVMNYFRKHDSSVRAATGVSDSVLSKHLKQMEEAGYVRLSKRSLDGRVRTRLSMTGKGRRAFKAHVAALHALASLADLSAAAE